MRFCKQVFIKQVLPKLSRPFLFFDICEVSGCCDNSFFGFMTIGFVLLFCTKVVFETSFEGVDAFFEDDVVITFSLLEESIVFLGDSFLSLLVIGLSSFLLLLLFSVFLTSSPYFLFIS